MPVDAKVSELILDVEKLKDTRQPECTAIELRDKTITQLNIFHWMVSLRTIYAWKYRDCICLIRKIYDSHFCGYSMFPHRPVMENGYNGILRWVPVHGGITFAQEYHGHMIYGFDTGHYNSGNFFTIETLVKECERMTDNIIASIPFEEAYLASSENMSLRASIVDAYHNRVGGFDIRDAGLFGILSFITGQI